MLKITNDIWEDSDNHDLMIEAKNVLASICEEIVGDVECDFHTSFSRNFSNGGTICFTVYENEATVRFASIPLDPFKSKFENGLGSNCVLEVNTDMFSEEDNSKYKDQIMLIYY